jgi:MYXO-CTERM domain-containing protein
MLATDRLQLKCNAGGSFAGDDWKAAPALGFGGALRWRRRHNRDFYFGTEIWSIYLCV